MSTKKLTKEQYYTLKEKGTEIPFTGKYLDNKKEGMYICANCGNKLFSSETKYNSGTGWPSFYKPESEESIDTKPDENMLMKRTEVLCKKCKGHLGHVFDDCPEPAKKRFCINSASLIFKKEVNKK